MVNTVEQVLIFATPALASAAVAGAAWRMERGRAAVRAGRAAAISVARALHGALLALLASAIALGVYSVLGIVARRLVTLGGPLWALSLMPLYFYALFVWLVVAGYTQCGPQAYECPL